MNQPVTRLEFYLCILGGFAFVLTSIFGTNSNVLEIKKAELNTRDSILTVMKDSAVARAMQYELKADSLQAVINRKKLDYQNIKKKYETEKNTVLVLNADSSLNLFTNNTAH